MNMNADTNIALKLHQIEVSIFSGKLTESQQHLTALEPDDVWMKRKKAHLLAKIQFAGGDYKSATRILEQTISELGANILLTADLLLCYFNTHQHLAWINLLDNLYDTLLKQKASIQNETWVRAAITIGGFLEEKGEVALAIELFRMAIELPDVDSVWRERVQAHLTRVLTYFGMSEELRKNYRLLLLPNSDSKQLLINWEKIHAQVLAEFCLLDRLQFSLRWAAFAKEHKQFPEIVKWLLYDLLEVSVLTRKEFPLSVEIFAEFPPTAAYESCLLFIMRSEFEQIANSDLEALTPFCKMKTLVCLARKNPELQQTVDLWLFTLTPDSQKLLAQAFQHLSGWKRSATIALAANSTLVVNTVQIQLSRKPVAWQILCLFAKQKKYSHEELAVALWGKDLTGAKDRLRMNIYRLNELLKVHLHGVQLLTITSEGVVLNSDHTVVWTAVLDS